MKIININNHYQEKIGVLTEMGVLDIKLAVKKLENNLSVPKPPTTIRKVIEQGAEAISQLKELSNLCIDYERTDLFIEEREISYGPSIPNPQKIICVGLNYRKHAKESKLPIPEQPILFSKFNNALCGHMDNIHLPSNAKKYDYEGELAIVIGKKAKNVSEEDALSYVFGYTIANDFSARDLQFRSNQWLLGKTCDNFCPIGPYLVSADEIESPNKLNISTYVNGELRQSSNTADMIFNCQQIISYVSHYMTLYPGDIILTGTPEGVIMGYEESKQNWLKPEDEIVVSIEQLGKLKNTLR